MCFSFADTAHRMKASVPTIVKYAKVELVPPKPTEIGEIRQGFSNICLAYKSKSYRNLSVKVSKILRSN